MTSEQTYYCMAILHCSLLPYIVYYYVSSTYILTLAERPTIASIPMSALVRLRVLVREAQQSAC